MRPPASSRALERDSSDRDEAVHHPCSTSQETAWHKSNWRAKHNPNKPGAARDEIQRLSLLRAGQLTLERSRRGTSARQPSPDTGRKAYELHTRQWVVAFPPRHSLVSDEPGPQHWHLC